MLWDSWWNVWRGRSLPQRRRVASGASLKPAADVAGAWTTQRVEPLEDRVVLTAGDLITVLVMTAKRSLPLAELNSSNYSVAMFDESRHSMYLLAITSSVFGGTNP